jgi:hypothetical protein
LSACFAQPFTEGKILARELKGLSDQTLCIEQ